MRVQHVPDRGLIAFCLPDLYGTGPADAELGLAYRRRLGMRRLAKVVEDQLGLDPDEALLVAAGLIGGVGEA